MTCGRRPPAAIARATIAASGMPRPPPPLSIAPAADAAADVRHADQHGQVEHAPELARPRHPRRELVAPERYQHTEEQRPEEGQNPVPERARRAGSSGGSAGSAMARSDPALASLTASSEMRWRIAPICTSAFGGPEPHDLILELPPGSCDPLAVEPLALRKERSGDGIGDPGRALGIAIGGRDVDDVRVLLDGGLDLVGDVIAVFGPRDAPGCLVEHLAGGEQGLGGRELALGGGLVGLGPAVTRSPRTPGGRSPCSSSAGSARPRPPHRS